MKPKYISLNEENLEQLPKPPGIRLAKPAFLFCVVVGVILLSLFAASSAVTELNSFIEYGGSTERPFGDDAADLLYSSSSEVENGNDRANVQISDDTLFLYKAYYETRSEVPTIRLSLNGRCDAVGNMDTLIEVNGQVLNTTHEAVTGKCPDGWASGCKYNAFDMISENYTGPVPKEVTVRRGNRTARLPVVPVATEFPLGLTVCIEPLYWFVDWPRLIVFMELWKLHGATKFLFYHHTMARNVKKVLDYYVKEGTADVRPWPLMPSSDSLDPNNSTYQLMEHLVEHDCSFRSTTKYTAMNDIDEFLFPFEGKLIDFLEETNNRTKNAGSFLFIMAALGFDPKIIPSPYNFEKNPYSGLLKPIVVGKAGPGKVIYLTQYTKVQQTHKTRRFFGKQKQYTISGKKALMMHARNSFADFVLNKTIEYQANLFPDEENDFHQQRIAKLTKIIFEDVTPSYSNRAAEVLQECVHNWQARMHNCKIPITGCQDKMDLVEDWIYTKADENSRYTVL